jgi:hypothetical protein
VNFLEARLEITQIHQPRTGEDGFDIVDLAPEARRDMLVGGFDGISCRDETIALQEARIASLVNDQVMMRVALQQLLDMAIRQSQADMFCLAQSALNDTLTAMPDQLVRNAWLKGLADARETVASITIRADGIPLSVTQRMCVSTLDDVIAKASEV